MDKPLTLGKLIDDCANGAYVGGETFRNNLGQELYCDGNRLIGIERVEYKSNWQYVENKKVV